MKKKLFIPFVILCVAALAFVLLVLCWINNPIRLTVVNAASKDLEDVVVNVGPHTHKFGDITSGTKKRIWFFYKGADSSFKLTIKGTTYNESWGYVTNGLGFQIVNIEIDEEGVVKFHQN